MDQLMPDMATEEERNEKEGQSIVAFRTELLDGNFEAARVIEREQFLPPQAVTSVVNSTFDEFLQSEEFVKAIGIGKIYELSPDKISDAIYMEFRRIIGTGDIDKAIEWGLANNLPDYEITRAAIKGIELAIINKNVESAVDIKKKYSVTEEQIGSIWQKGYDVSFKEGKFYDAALLSREFGMSERKTIITASKAFRKALQSVDFDRMVLCESEFRIFNDIGFSLLGEEEGRSLIKLTEEFIKKHLRTESFTRVVNLIHGLGVLYKEINNHTLKDLVHFVYSQSIAIHQLFLQENRYEDALWIKNELNLLEDNTPEKTLREIYNQAVSFHNQYLKNEKFLLAMKVKKDYDLLGAQSNADSIDLIQNMIVIMLTKLIEKGDTKIGNELIKEYNIPQKETEQVANNAVINSLNDGRSERAIDIVSRFQVDIGNYDVEVAAKEAFDQCRKSGYQETAANLGFIFEIDSTEVKNSARLVWEDLIRRNEYKKAAAIKKKHKLSKRFTDNVAKEEYNMLMQANKIETAQKLREEYKLNLGIFTWIIEFFKKLFMLFLGKENQPTHSTAIETPAEEISPESPPIETANTE